MILVGATGAILLHRHFSRQNEAFPTRPVPLPVVRPTTMVLAPAAKANATERAQDAQALDRVLAKGSAEFATLEEHVRSVLGEAEEPIAMAGRLRTYPYQVHRLGETVDHLALRTPEVRQFQTRLTRIFYDASQQLTSLLETMRRGRKDTMDRQRQAFLANGEALAKLTSEWSTFAGAVER